MNVLGISAYERDAAAALVVDGRCLAAAQEERFSRKRGDPDFPRRAVHACLDVAGLGPEDLERVVFYERPLRKFERVFVSQLRGFPLSAGSFARTMFAWLGDRLWVKNRLAEYLGLERDKIAFCDHALAQAAAGFASSGLAEAAVCVLDDVGEWSTVWTGRGGPEGLEALSEQRFPHSPGLFASALTQYLGFEPGADEHLVEGLARLGEPKHLEQLGSFVRVGDDGTLHVDPQGFRFVFHDRTWFSKHFVERVGPERAPGGELACNGGDRRHADVAASGQALLESHALALAKRLKEKTDADALCLAGALAANAALVSRLRAEGPFARVHASPTPHKSGGAVGAALYASLELGDRPFGERAPSPPPGLPEDLGPALETPTDEHADEDACLADAARRLEAGEAIGWIQGGLPFADDRFGHRVALAYAGRDGAAATLLEAIQRPEPYRQTTLLVPRAQWDRWLATPACDGVCLATPTDALRERAPSAIGADGRVRARAVDDAPDEPLPKLLDRLGRDCGVPLLLAVPLALRGSPVVRTAQDALDAFRRTRLDALFVGRRAWTAE